MKRCFHCGKFIGQADFDKGRAIQEEDTLTYFHTLCEEKVMDELYFKMMGVEAV